MGSGGCGGEGTRSLRPQVGGRAGLPLGQNRIQRKSSRTMLESNSGTGHLWPGLRRTLGGSPQTYSEDLGKPSKTWFKLDTDLTLGRLKADHPDATRVGPEEICPAHSRCMGTWADKSESGQSGGPETGYSRLGGVGNTGRVSPGLARVRDLGQFIRI